MNIFVLRRLLHDWEETFAESKAFWLNTNRVDFSLACTDLTRSQRRELLFGKTTNHSIGVVCRVVHKTGWDPDLLHIEDPKRTAPVVHRKAELVERDGFIGVRWDRIATAIDQFQYLWQITYRDMAKLFGFGEERFREFRVAVNRWRFGDPQMVIKTDTFFRMSYMLADDPMVFFRDNRLNRYPSMSALEFRQWQQ